MLKLPRHVTDSDIKRIIDRMMKEKYGKVLKTLLLHVVKISNAIILKIPDILIALARQGKLEKFKDWLVEEAISEGVCDVQEMRAECDYICMRECATRPEPDCRETCMNSCLEEKATECEEKIWTDSTLILQTAEKHVDELDLDTSLEKLSDSHKVLIASALGMLSGLLSEFEKEIGRKITVEDLYQLIEQGIDNIENEKTREQMRSLLNEIKQRCPRLLNKVLKWLLDRTEEIGKRRRELENNIRNNE